MFDKVLNIGKTIAQTAEGKTKLGQEIKEVQKDVKIVANVVKQGQKLLGKGGSDSGGSSSNSNNGENSGSQSGDDNSGDENQNSNNGGSNQTVTQVKEGITLAKDVFKLGQSLAEHKGDTRQELKQGFEVAKDVFKLGKSLFGKKNSNNKGSSKVQQGATLAKDAFKLGQGILQKGGTDGGQVQEGLTLAKDVFKLGSTLMNKNGDKSQEIKQGVAVAKDIFKLGESIAENKGGNIGDEVSEAKEGFTILKSVVKFGMGLIGSKNKKKSNQKKQQTSNSQTNTGTGIGADIDKSPNQNNNIPTQTIPQPISSQEQIDESYNIEFSLNFSSPISIRGLLQWKIQEGKLTHESLTLGDRIIPIKDMKKIKCLSQQTLPGKWKIKITKIDNQQFVFGAEAIDNIKSKFSLQYLWYAHLICNKLLALDHKIDKPFSAQKKFKTKISKPFCKGMLYKRSQHLKDWQERYVVINQAGLFSHRAPNQDHTFSIKAHSAKYMWTRFQIFNERLIIKIKHGIEQTEFGIPIVNFCNKSKHNWLYSFYRIMMETKLSKTQN